MRRLAAFLACTLAGLAPYAVLRTETDERYHGWLAAVSLLAGVAVLVGVRLNRPATVRPWQAVAAACGVAVPLGLARTGRDPAQGASVLLTFITDSMGFLLFLGLARIFLR